MAKKKYTPPTWDETKQRWKKNAYCNGMSKTFTSKKRSASSAWKEIEAQADLWKDKVQGLSVSSHGFSPMSRVEEIYLEFKVDIESRTGASNWRPVESRMDHWVLPLIGKTAVCDINDGAVQRVINHAYKDGKLSKKSLRNIRGDLMSFIKFCRKNGLTGYNPEDISIPQSASYREKNILQPQELKVLFSVDTTLYRGKPVLEPYIYAYRLQVIYCLRPGEMGGLRKSDRIGNTVCVRRSINIEGETTHGKNENALRSFALSGIGIECWDKLAALSKSDQLLPDYNSKRYYDRLKKYCRSNGIAPISPYELRHTSFSVAQTLPEGLARQMGGHSQNMDTFGIYGHQIAGDLELTSDLMQDRISILIDKADSL